MPWETHSRNGLILAAATGRFAEPAHMLQRAARRGELVRLRQGAYCLSEEWARANARHKHILRVRAVVGQSKGDAVVAGVSAGAVWGFPSASPWPTEVTLLHAARSGGKSEPGVRRTSAGAKGAATTAVDGIQVTSVARTALDLARGRDFPIAVAMLDWARWRKNDHRVSVDELWTQLHRARFRTGAATLARAIEFSTSLSDSIYESRARASMELLGFVSPELQHTFVDEEGELTPDYYWRTVNKAAEFDGQVKYTDEDYSRGDPARVFWNEKRREDRLRRMVDGVTRFVAVDVDDPRRLERLLVSAGIPRR